MQCNLQFFAQTLAILAQVKWCIFERILMFRYYCVGHCTRYGGYAFGTQSGDESFYSELMNAHAGSLGLSPCCAPVRFDPLTVTVRHGMWVCNFYLQITQLNLQNSTPHFYIILFLHLIYFRVMKSMNDNSKIKFLGNYIQYKWSTFRVSHTSIIEERFALLGY